MLLCLANIGDVMADIFRYVYSKICCCGCCRGNKKKRDQQNNATDPDNNDNDTPEAWRQGYEKNAGNNIVVDDDEDEDEFDEDHVSVPLTVTLLIISFYLFMGALLFGVWEEWDALMASYFCFVTISTIGFGDVVPGSANFATQSGQLKMIFASLYTLFGLALLSMCFSLIQEEIASKFRWLGEKLGLVETFKDDDDDEAEEVIMDVNNTPEKMLANKNY